METMQNLNSPTDQKLERARGVWVTRLREMVAE